MNTKPITPEQTLVQQLIAALLHAMPEDTERMPAKARFTRKEIAV